MQEYEADRPLIDSSSSRLSHTWQMSASWHLVVFHKKYQWIRKEVGKNQSAPNSVVEKPLDVSFILAAISFFSLGKLLRYITLNWHSCQQDVTFPPLYFLSLAAKEGAFTLTAICSDRKSFVFSESGNLRWRERQDPCRHKKLSLSLCRTHSNGM